MEEQFLDYLLSGQPIDIIRLECIPIEAIAAYNRVFVSNLEAGTISNVRFPRNFIRTFSTIQMLLDGLAECVRKFPTRNPKRELG